MFAFGFAGIRSSLSNGHACGGSMPTRVGLLAGFVFVQGPRLLGSGVRSVWVKVPVDNVFSGGLPACVVAAHCVLLRCHLMFTRCCVEDVWLDI